MLLTRQERALEAKKIPNSFLLVLSPGLSVLFKGHHGTSKRSVTLSSWGT